MHKDIDVLQSPRHHRGQHRERQREQRVAEADELEEVANGFQHVQEYLRKDAEVREWNANKH